MLTHVGVQAKNISRALARSEHLSGLVRSLNVPFEHGETAKVPVSPGEIN